MPPPDVLSGTSHDITGGGKMIREANRLGQSVQSFHAQRTASAAALRRRRLALLLATCAALPAALPVILPLSARAADGSWSFNGSGVWSDTTAWVNATVADGTG